MTALRKLALLLVAAGSVLSAQAQTGQSDADRRLRNREAAMEHRLKLDREGGTSVPAVTPGPWRHRHGYHRVHHGRKYLHRHHVR